MQNQMEYLAREVLLLCQNTLLVNLRFLDAALSQFKLEPGELSFGTDGQKLFYRPSHVLRRYKEEREGPVRDYLHLVFHCIFRHMYAQGMEPETWDLACDIAVESAINGLGLACAAARRQQEQQQALEQLKGQVGQLTAEKLYRWYQDHPLPPGQYRQMRALFQADDHDPWRKPPAGRGGALAAGRGGDSGEEGVFGLSRRMEQTWKELSQQIQLDLETFSQRQGTRAGDLTQNLREVNREKYDYTAFLKKFAVRGEAMKINPDEFDYVFYTYGLKLFGNMPLIEPLEYKEVKRIREFVIAIDTSGSVAGELVQTFVQKTYNILQSTESFFSKINLHIIQCDAEIQQDIKITSREEFDEYLKTMQIHGLGGTDFRPVFQYVDQLRLQREFQNLKGLIYFTDGYGTFPAQKPDYDAAFVFIEEELQNPEVPPWAIKLVLRKDEI